MDTLGNTKLTYNQRNKMFWTWNWCSSRTTNIIMANGQENHTGVAVNLQIMSWCARQSLEQKGTDKKNVGDGLKTAIQFTKVKEMEDLVNTLLHFKLKYSPHIRVNVDKLMENWRHQVDC